ncbi:hypothetical protein F4801DRAFT_151571 [Xylaria longipes]|nr:hypothetical protein F4801DRAFT_151571 [Xylaria longipes]
MWVEGPAYTHFEYQLSFAATRICDLALDAKIPCISFTPKAKYEIQPKKTISTAVSKRQATLIALLYLVTGQLIWLLPSTFESRLRTDEVIGSLDGRFASAAVALDLIEALLEHIPPMLLVIIDKLNLADSPETRPYLTRLIAMLHGQDTTKVIKTLFTTAGSCAVLAKTTTRGERADAGRMVQGKPGQHLRGWSSVGNLKLT